MRTDDERLARLAVGPGLTHFRECIQALAGPLLPPRSPVNARAVTGRARAQLPSDRTTIRGARGRRRSSARCARRWWSARARTRACAQLWCWGKLAELRALRAGADDWAALPLRYPVLLERVRALLRRTHRRLHHRAFDTDRLEFAAALGTRVER